MIVRTSLAGVLVLALSLAGADGRPRSSATPKPAPEGKIVAKLVDREIAVPRQSLRAAWTQYGPAGVLEARAVVEGPVCPRIMIDLEQRHMEPRAAADANFLTICSAVIPADTQQAALVLYHANLKSVPPGLSAGDADIRDWIAQESGDPASATTKELDERYAALSKRDVVPLPVPVADPQRIVVFGDTGCRIKGKALQDCSDPEKWPFARIAAEAAKLKPDLIIHVGDYLYRENACPDDFKGCTGTPFGDNWPTWDADFFAPAKPLLAVAPWVIVRGNHEDCQRAGAGFLRLLGPGAFDPKAACADHLAQYAIPFAALNLVVADNADAPEMSVVEKSVPVYRAEIAGLANEKAPTWWLLHRPVWGLISGPLGVPIGGNQTLIASLPREGIPPAVELMLAGHIHTFEAINYEFEPNDPATRIPPQLIAGFGGDMLDRTPENLHGAIFQGSSGVHVKDGLSIGGFGFALMTRNDDGWRIDVYDPKGQIERVCQFHKSPVLGRLDCPRPKR